jgi:hypothetical protein
LPHANRPLKMPFATTAAQKISYLTRSFKILGTKCLVFQFSSSSVMWDFPDFYVNNYLTNSSQVYFTLFSFFFRFCPCISAYVFNTSMISYYLSSLPFFCFLIFQPILPYFCLSNWFQRKFSFYFEYVYCFHVFINLVLFTMFS